MVLGLVVFVYLASVVVGLNVVYLHVQNESPVTYYADPRLSRATMQGQDLDDFLTAFAQPPKRPLLRVTGYTLLGDDHPSEWHSALQGGFVEWDGALYRVAFTFCLDLSAWVSRAQVSDSDRLQLRSSAERGDASHMHEEGFTSDSLGAIAYFLAHDTNDLSILHLHKDIEWPGWEELATNIRQRIRQQGFSGTIHVSCPQSETTSIYKNKRWANFMHNRTTKALFAVSIIGFIPYCLYMRFRCHGSAVRVRARHRIEISPQDYWQFISEGLCAAGFQPALAPEVGGGGGAAAIAGGEDGRHGGRRAA